VAKACWWLEWIPPIRQIKFPSQEEIAGANFLLLRQVEQPARPVETRTELWEAEATAEEAAETEALEPGPAEAEVVAELRGLQGQ